LVKVYRALKSAAKLGAPDQARRKNKRNAFFFIFAPRKIISGFQFKKKEEETVNPPPKKINKKPCENFTLN
jgi:hypothetical protein